MFTASRPLNAAQAAHYYETEYSRGDYYTSSDDVAEARGEWFGEASRELGLTGVVEACDFAALLEGRNGRGEALTQQQTGTGKRRAGWDFTCSADKSVSIAALALGDERLIQAHDAAVKKAMTELERHVQTRMRHGKSDAAREVQTTNRMATALFRHESSRNLDPQLHTHCVVFNVTRREDGQWRALESRGLFQEQKLLTAVYRSDMARSLRELGYGVEVRHDGSVGISGITREQIEAFSTRRAEVLAKVKELGEERTDRKSGAAVRQLAAHSTRKSKVRGIDRKDLFGAWRNKATKDLGLSTRDLLRQGRIQDVSAPAAREVVRAAVDHLSERQTIFSVSALERASLERGMGRLTLGDIRKEIGDQKDLVRAGGVVTTERAIEEERQVLRRMKDGQGKGESIPVTKLPSGLSAEQQRAVHHVLETNDRLLGIEGKAGTGKSYTFSAIQETAERAGWRVRGFAPTTPAVQGLRDAGLEATTVARLTRSKTQDAPGRQLWIVDEAGMLSRKQASALLQKAQEARAKVVLVGDRMQHRAVEAGEPFAQLVDGGMRTVRLEEIRRQKDAGLRAAVAEASCGRAGRALLQLQEQGRVKEIPDRGERHRAVAEHYMRLPGKVLVVTGDNAERREVNHLIREARIREGQVQHQSVKAEVLVSKDLTSAERKEARSYAVGDHVTYREGSSVYGIGPGARGRIAAVDPAKNAVRVKLDGGEVVSYSPRRLSGVEVAQVEERRFAVGDRIEFRSPDKDQRIVNGALARVTHLDAERGQAVVRLDNGSQVALDLKRPQAIDHGYASTSYRSQSRTVDSVIDLEASSAVSREKVYVSVSRAEHGVHVYTDNLPALVKRVERERPKERALDLVEPRPAHPSAERPHALQAGSPRDWQKEAFEGERRIREQLARPPSEPSPELQDQLHELRQRQRADIDPQRHWTEATKLESLTQKLQTAQTGRGAIREQWETQRNRLYDLRHGPERSNLGPQPRLSEREERALHDAQRALGDRSPIKREDLARLDSQQLRQVASSMPDLADTSKRAQASPNSPSLKQEVQQKARDVETSAHARHNPRIR